MTILETLSTYLIWFTIYSVVGWIVETVSCSFIAKRFVNRGFLNGPYCPIWGFGGILMYLLFNGIENWLVIFVASLVLATILEYITSWLMEIIFKARWWDYSHKFFNINGRVCFSNAILFGIGGVLVVEFINPFLKSLTDQIPLWLIPYVALVILAGILTDGIYTFARLSKFKQKIFSPDPEIFFRTNPQERRVIRAFPDLKIKNKKAEKFVAEVRKYVKQKHRDLKAFEKAWRKAKKAKKAKKKSTH